MKLLFVHTTLARYPGDPEGGTGNSWLDLFIELSKKHEITVITPLKENSKKFEKIGNLKIIRVPPIKPSRSTFQSMIFSMDIYKIPLSLINMYLEIKKQIKNNKFDYIHSFFVIPAGFLVQLSGTNSIKIISGLGSDIHNWSYKPIIKNIVSHTLKNCDTFIGVSKDICERAEKLGAKKIYCLPTPVNLSRFKFSKSIIEPHSLVYTGRIDRKKGLFILVESIREVKKQIPDVKVYICGDGPDKKKLIELITKNNLEENFVFTGFISQKEMVKIIQKCKVFILPSFGEGFPASLIEAMAIGRPAIVTNVGGMKEIIAQNGKVIIPVVKDLEKSIITVINTNYNLKTISTSMKKYDSKVVANQYNKVYSGDIALKKF